MANANPLQPSNAHNNADAITGKTSSIVVQKYGGTSVGDIERIRKVAARIARNVEQGEKVAVTVSAMGHSTDRLISMAKEITARPHKRELDMLMATGEQQSIALLAMALQQQGVRARSFTGQQAGFLTDSFSGGARILQVNPQALRDALQDHDVVVIAGFQGVDEHGMITTFGRGGSDTTAVAVAAALQARECEIYTDTEGVYTTDPHVVPQARKLETIDYQEMLELASLGAQVLHPRSVWYARRYGVVIHVRSSFSYNRGTIVTDNRQAEAAMKTDQPVTGVALDQSHARIDILDVPDTPGIAARIFSSLGEAGIVVDMIVQGVAGRQSDHQQIAFTVNQDAIDDALETLKPVLEELGGRAVANKDVAKLSIVGIAIGSTPSIAGTMFAAVAQVGANIGMITTSEVRISVVIPSRYAEDALQAVHSAFALDRENGAN